MILLIPETASPAGGQDVLVGLFETQTTQLASSPLGYTKRVVQAPDTDVKAMDTALKQVLRTYAIDPSKIAVLGFSNGGSYALLLGRNNMDVFSRVGDLSGPTPFYGNTPSSAKTQFLIAGGIGEHLGGRANNMIALTLGVAHELRTDGHPVEMLLAPRGHRELTPELDYVWGWLARSWAWTTAADAPVAHNVSPTTEPMLSAEVLAKMTAFWNTFSWEPDSIRTDARLAYETYLTLALGRIQTTVPSVDMVALAARYPTVMADLNEVGLTAQQEKAYRTAIVRAVLTQLAGPLAGSVSVHSVFRRNLAFLKTHAAAFRALADTGIWTNP
jgi:predicted esterase